MKKQTLIPLLILLLLGAACAPAPTLSRDDQLATIVALTLTAQPTLPIPTSIPPSTVTSLPTDASPPAVTASGPLTVSTVVQNVNLRTGPGVLFTVSRVMPQGTRLQVLGLAPGREWVSVLNDEGINGWVGVHVVEAFPVDGFPTVDPTDVKRITGRVLDENGLPISGIGFAIQQQTGSKSLRTDAVTDAAGIFYAYLPQHLSGIWTASHVSVACTSNTMDADCNCLNAPCGDSYPESATVSLPASEPLTFTWK